MKKISIPAIAFLFALIACTNHSVDDKKSDISIIPKPVSIEQMSGSFQVTGKTKIFIPEGVDVGGVDSYLIEYLNRLTGLDHGMAKKEGSKGVIAFTLTEKEELGLEGYQLEVTKTGISIKANTSKGLFYGVQTLLQMMPTDVFSLSPSDIPEIKIPCCKIIDQPRFSWRGMHLDVSRHFFDVDFIKRYIDIIAMHKMNVFHWHLTDDNGWRIEIDKYPKLTEVSAWRVDREDMHWREVTPPKPGEKASYGGYYTQDEIREVVQYAAERHIEVIPEIEMPGHTSEVFAAYPGLSCTEGEFYVQPGVYWPNVDIFCAGKEETFEFIENVLLEVIELFPAEYIHIGGDEAEKRRWEACEKCQKRIIDEGLTDEHELQSWFIKRVEKFLLANGKKMIGWDEILEGGLAPEATVMSWRGIKGGIQAAQQGHNVIMSPTSHCYFDYYQANPDFEPVAIGGFLTLKKVYDFEPVPGALTDDQIHYVLGAQGNVWTEYIADPEHVEYMAIPRMTALAEVVWSPAGGKDWNDFQTRLQDQFRRFDAMGVNYSTGSWKVDIQPVMKNDMYYVELSSEQYDVPVYYTLDGTDPSVESAVYAEPLAIHESTMVKAVLFENDQMKEYPSEKEIVFHLGLGKKASLEYPASPHYPGKGALSLVDGLKGSDNFRSGYWMGFEGIGIIGEVDLGGETSVSMVSTGFLQNSGAWIFLPETLEVLLLDAQKEVVGKKVLEPEATMEVRGTIIEEMEAEFDQVMAAYVRIIAPGIKSIPEWMDGAGEKGWLFIDEVIIK